VRETDGTLAKTPRIKVVPANMKLVDATRVELEQLDVGIMTLRCDSCELCVTFTENKGARW
jgi:hypothetical protein